MTRAAALALGVLAASAACRRQSPPAPERPALGAIAVRDVTSAAEGPSHLDVPALERELGARLRASGLFAQAVDGGAGPVARVRAQVATEAAEVDDRGVARARVGIRIETRPSDAPGAIEENLEGQGERPYAVAAAGKGAAASRADALDGLVRRVMRDLLDGLTARRRLQGGSPEAIHAALVGDGGELREEAIRMAGQRQLRQEVPALLKLLGDPDEATRDAALGALIALRERRAVTELTKTRSLHDRREMRKIIEAIAILGGREAEDYLSFVAETHDDDEIRSAAAAAKARLERRGADGDNHP